VVAEVRGADPLALADESGALPRFDPWVSALLAFLGVAGLIGLGLAASAASTTAETARPGTSSA
jgi:hypothetical protein